MEIKITRAPALKEKPDSSTLVFGKNMTDHMFIVDYERRPGLARPPHHPLRPPSRSTPPQRCSTMARRSSRA